MVMQGNTAPDFTLETDRGAKVALSHLRGRQIVLFFYPKDDAPGCTIECKEFRDAYGVWGPTKWGEGIRRTTVIVGADAGIKKVFENVTPQRHAAEVLAAL